MTRFIILLAVMLTVFMAEAETFSYRFNSTPLPKAIRQILDDHPDLNINFIYNELETYKTNATVIADNPHDALRQAIGLNPVTVIKSGNSYYLEALQQGKYVYTGKAVGADNEPVVAATVMLLAPKDSTVLTYGITDATGHFSIPCDRQDVIAKLTCIGYKPTYRKSTSFSFGTIKMNEHPIQLKSVSVEAEYASVYSDRTVYRPTPRQKKASANATDLLLQMALPQIDVNPITKAVKLVGGGDIAVFIDYIKSTPQDLQSMLPSDVKRVEFMVFPTDPRFKGANYVLNFVMQKYEWGGYTRLEADKWFSVNRTEGNIYSKFAYKNMTFDIFADEIFFSNRHGGFDMSEQFRFTDLHGKGPQTIQRHEYTDKYKYRESVNDITFRASYNTESTQFSNSLNFALNNIPTKDVEGRVEYSDQVFSTQLTSRSESSKDYAINFNSDYYHSFNDEAAFSTEASLIYGHNTLNSDYRNSDNLNIMNNAVENTYSASILPMMKWSPADKHALSFSGDGRYARHKIDYSGNSPSQQVYNILVGMIGVGYDFISEKFRGGTTISWALESNDIAGIRTSNSFPVFEIHSIFAPNQKQQIELSLNWGRYVPEVVNKSPNILQQDALMWYTGTPDIKDNSTAMTRLNYTWLISNQWQCGFNSQYYQSNDRIAAVYLPTGPDGTMLKKYMNSGSFQCGMIGLSGTARLLDGKLAIMARPQLWLRRSSGVYNLKNTDFVYQTTLTYYFGKFNLFAYYSTPSKYIEEENGYVERTSSRYMLSIGWHHGPWHAGATAYNFLHTNWKAGKMILKSQFYDYTRQEFDTDLHQRFSISLSYTFNYGKKVDTYDEASGRGTAQSAILK